MKTKLLGLGGVIVASTLMTGCGIGNAIQNAINSLDQGSVTAPTAVAAVIESQSVTPGTFTTVSCVGLESGSLCYMNVAWQNANSVQGGFNVTNSLTYNVVESPVSTNLYSSSLFVSDVEACSTMVFESSTGSCNIRLEYVPQGESYSATLTFFVGSPGTTIENTQILGTSNPIMIGGN